MKLSAEFYKALVRELYVDRSSHISNIEFLLITQRDPLALGRAIGHMLKCKDLSCLHKSVPLPRNTYPEVPKLVQAVRLFALGSDAECEALADALNPYSTTPWEKRAEVARAACKYDAPDLESFLSYNGQLNAEEIALITRDTPLAGDTSEEFFDHLAELIELNLDIQRHLAEMFAALADVHQRFVWVWPDNNN